MTPTDKLADLRFRDLLDRFASTDPTPGGGSAAAAAGALGASLLAMVAGMSKTKSGTPEERTALGAARAELLRQRDALIGLIDRDTQAYDRVVAAYRLPKATDEEKAARTAAIQAAMRGAAETPLETMRVCAEAARAGRIVATSGNPGAMSDVASGIAFLGSGMHAALLNVAINLDGIKDAALRTSLANEALSAMTGLHHEPGEGHAGPAADLLGKLLEYAGKARAMPSAEAQSAMIAAESLRRLGSPDAKQALERLAQAADERVAAPARQALARLDRPA